VPLRELRGKKTVLIRGQNFFILNWQLQIGIWQSLPINPVRNIILLCFEISSFGKLKFV